MINKESTRYYSDKQEKTVCKELGAIQSPNSGAGKWRKGDARHESASLLIECKTCIQDKKSFSIKEEWFKKNKEECFSQRLENSCIAFNFGPDKPNYYVIDSKLMKFLVEKLEEYND